MDRSPLPVPHHQGRDTVHLQPRMMDVLVFLAGRPGQMVSKATILDAVWPEEFVANAVLNRAISELRRALGDDARSPRYLETIHKRGYRLVAEVSVVLDQDRGRAPEAGAAQAARPAFESTPQLLGPDVRCYLVCGDSEAALAPGEYVIGRGEEASLVIRHARVSRQHARVRVGEEGAFIEDLGSKNGTFVRGQRIELPVQLKDGDRILLGEAEIVFRDLVALSTRT